MLDSWVHASILSRGVTETSKALFGTGVFVGFGVYLTRPIQ
jgi:hypothetical protein